MFFSAIRIKIMEYKSRKGRFALKKFLKWLAALTLVGTVIGMLAAYLYKTQTNTDSKNDNTANEEDFDLDTDLQPVADREYVPLKKTEEKPEEDTLA